MAGNAFSTRKYQSNGSQKSFAQPRYTNGRRRRRAPHPQEPADRDPPPDEIADGAKGRPIEKPPHRVIEPVLSNSDEIDVVGQAHRKSVTRRDRGNLQNGDAGAQDPVAQHPDVQIERRNVRVLDRLADRQQELDLVEQVVPDADDRARRVFDAESRDAGRRGEAGNGAAGTRERRQVAVDRQRLAVSIRKESPLVPRTERQPVARVTTGGFGAIDEQRRSGNGRDVGGRRDDDLVLPARAIELPRCLEELEELFDDGSLPRSGDDADQNIRSAGDLECDFMNQAVVTRRADAAPDFATKAATHSTT